jgi:thiamine-monophosphate kinase
MVQTPNPPSRPPVSGWKSPADSPKKPQGELALLHSIRQRASASPLRGGSGSLRLGIGDDCAILRPRAGEELAVTTDLSIEGRHFRLEWHPPESVGHRTLARGLSDLAAMGSRPVAAFLSLGLPAKLTRQSSIRNHAKRSWFDRFLDGLLALAAQHDIPLAGGDLAESPLAVADIVLTGAVPQGKALLRSTANVGDRLYVTGALGGAAAELAQLAKSPRTFAKETLAGPGRPHLYPQPRVAQGLWLRQRGLATAAMDLSDGLSTDVVHICEESGVSAEIDASALPLAAGATLEMALQGGEDYELLFSAPENARIPRSISGVPITQIGRLIDPEYGAKSTSPRAFLLTAGRRERLAQQGWQHFQQ